MYPWLGWYPRLGLHPRLRNASSTRMESSAQMGSSALDAPKAAAYLQEMKDMLIVISNELLDNVNEFIP